MASVTYNFNFGENGMSDEMDYTITVTGDPIPADAVITSGTFSFTIGLSGYSSDETMRLKKFYINGLENYIGYGKAYGDSTWWDTSNRVTFSGNLVILDSNPSAFTSGSFSLLLQLSYGGTFSGVNGREGSITINYTEVTPTVTAPTNLQIVQNDNGTFTARWDVSVGTNGSGDITYQLWRYDDDLSVSDKTTSLSVTCNISAYNVALQYYVIAYYSGTTAPSLPVTVTFTDKLPVWLNDTQLTSITVVKNGVSTKITSLTVVKDGVSTKLF